MNQIAKFLKQEDGVAAIEYALLGSLIALAIVAIVTTLGGTLRTVFTTINTSL